MTGRGVEPFSDETLRCDSPERAEQLRIVSRVVGVLPDRADYMPVLRALLAPMRPALPPHGVSRSPEYAEARTAWLDRCRAWLIGQGLMPRGRQIGTDQQQMYTDATGDHFVPPRVPDSTRSGER